MISIDSIPVTCHTTAEDIGNVKSTLGELLKGFKPDRRAAS
jgi:hypothetical protein